MLVTQLRRIWSQSGASIAHSLQPGLTDVEMDALMNPLGLRLPEELRGWWGSHNGASRANGGSMYTFNRARYESLEDAVAGTQIGRAVAEDVREDFETLGLPLYRPTFLTVMSLLNCYVVCDCSDPDLAPVYCYWPEEPWRMKEPVVPRFADLLRWWLDAHQNGVYELVNEDGRKHLVRVNAVAPERLASGFM